MIFALITRLFTGEVGLFFARLKRVVGLYVVMAILTLGLVIFLVTALFIWASRHFGSLETALGFSGVFVVLLVVTYLLSVLAQRKSAPRDDDRLQRDIASIAGVAALSNAPQLVRAMKQRRGVVLVPVAVAGFYGLYRLLASFRDR